MLGSEILIAEERPDEAEALLDQGADAHPANLWMPLRLARARHARGAIAEARESLDRVIKIAPEKKPLWQDLEINLLFEERRWPEAIEILEGLRNRGALNLTERIRLARAYSDKNDSEAETACLLEAPRKAMLEPVFLRYVFWRHVKTASAELVDTVLNALRAQDRHELADELALVTYIQTMQYDLALEVLRRHKIAKRTNTEALRLIQVLFGSHQFALGTRYARLCLRCWPEDSSIWSACVRNLMKLGALDQVAQTLTDAKDRLPTEVVAQMQHLYCGYRADFEGATTAFEQLLAAGQCQQSIQELQIKLMFNLMELKTYDQVTHRIGQPGEWENRPLHRRGLPGAFLIELALEKEEAPEGEHVSVEDWARARPNSCVAATRLVDSWWSAGSNQRPAPPHAEAPQTIPRQIFQYWDKPSLPGPISHMVESWKNCAGFTHEIFNRRSAANFLRSTYGSKWSRAFGLARTTAGEADMLRLCVLAERGGVYADADDVLYGDLDALLKGTRGLLLYRETLGGALGNNFIAAPPKHPVLVSAAEMACRALSERSVETAWTQTGPGLLTRAVAQYVLDVGAEHARSQITVLDWPSYASHVASHNPVEYKIKKGHWVADQNIIRPSEIWNVLHGAAVQTPA
ncbi:TPR-domain containing protein [Candidatus Rhodobacter oscarellae]|uniref:TPR-domain containing protein n=1 Tax=Candidatus Rhodobacter oscarellae TaxID=1675527 RepID=A0A0J9EA80_9RHOB|nr:tetratricopeptide repeat protein [Candidatus Rhodobacter lobularis]KMW58574.1 TPR-domain containing protein [Candidatus Rhodobacter lobularis]